MNTKGIVNIEGYLLDYFDTLDAVKLVKKYGCSLDEAIDTLDCFKKSDMVKKILLALD